MLFIAAEKACTSAVTFVITSGEEESHHGEVDGDESDLRFFAFFDEDEEVAEDC
jgi:hypothetical protein